MRHVLAIVSSVDDPSARFRLGSYAAAFRDRGVELAPVAWPAGAAGRRDLVRAAGDYDSVVLLRRLLSPASVRRLRRAAKRLVYEYDDAMPFRDSARGATGSWSRRRKFRAAVDAADAVVAGNDYLASLAHPREATVVPTVVPDFPDPPAADRGDPAHETPVVGWLGTSANFPYLASIGRALAAAREAVRFRFAVMAERAPDLEGVPVDYHAWSLATEARFLRSLDVGIMPLFADAWCRGKCGLKALQYMAAGRAVIASAVPGPADVVGPGGVTCADDDAWRDALVGLLEDPARRRTLGALGRDRVAARYRPDVWTDRLLALYLGEDGPVAAGTGRTTG